MWGSAFADLAKKAEEYQKQPTQAASKAWSAASFFNLDAMQNHNEDPTTNPVANSSWEHPNDGLCEQNYSLIDDKAPPHQSQTEPLQPISQVGDDENRAEPTSPPSLVNVNGGASKAAETESKVLLLHTSEPAPNLGTDSHNFGDMNDRDDEDLPVSMANHEDEPAVDEKATVTADDNDNRPMPNTSDADILVESSDQAMESSRLQPASTRDEPSALEMPNDGTVASESASIPASINDNNDAALMEQTDHLEATTIPAVAATVMSDVSMKTHNQNNGQPSGAAQEVAATEKQGTPLPVESQSAEHDLPIETARVVHGGTEEPPQENSTAVAENETDDRSNLVLKGCNVADVGKADLAHLKEPLVIFPPQNSEEHSTVQNQGDTIETDTNEPQSAPMVEECGECIKMRRLYVNASEELHTIRANEEQRRLEYQRLMEQDVGRISVLERELAATNEALELERRQCQLERDSEHQQQQLQTQKFNELQERLKGVARELKDRRVECRSLITELEATNQHAAEFENQAESSKNALDLKTQEHEECSLRLASLHSDYNKLQLEFKQVKAAIDDARTKDDAALVDYKKKAQAALAAANARAADALRQRDEAEAENEATKLAAQNAVITANDALTALSAAKESNSSLSQQVSELKTRNIQQSKEVAELQSELSDREDRVADALAQRDEAIAKATGVCQQLSELQLRMTALRDEKARSELREAAVEKQFEGSTVSLMPIPGEPNDIRAETSDDVNGKPSVPSAGTTGATTDVGEEDDTDAAWCDTLEVTTRESKLTDDRGADESVASPLFFALEKQAELRTAQVEINRLANLLAELQADKTEAMEAAEECRKRAAQSEAKLRRYKKMDTSARHITQNSMDGGNESASAARTAAGVNIEYLKNILLRFLQSDDPDEKRSLVSVIGAVLCLTTRELETAMSNIEARKSIFSAFG